MNAGSIIAQGSYNELRSSKNLALLDNINEDESHQQLEEEVKPTLQVNVPKSSSLSSNTKQEADKELSASRYDVFGLIVKYFQYVNNRSFLIFVFAMIGVAQIAKTYVSLHIADW